VIGAEIPRPPAHRITLTQLAVLAALSLFLLVIDSVYAVSVLSGGLIAILPQAYFANRIFKWRGGSSGRVIARSGYVGLIGKFVLSIMGFAIVFATLRPIEGLAVFAGFLAMLTIQIIGSWLLLK
jgi:ATP synthase protein I